MLHRPWFTVLATTLAAGALGCHVTTGAGPGGPPPPAYGEPAPAQPAAPHAGPTQPATTPASTEPTAAAADACPLELGAEAPETPDGAPALSTGTLKGCYAVGDKRDVFTLTAPQHAGPVLYRLALQSTGHACLEAKDADRAVIGSSRHCAQDKGARLDTWVVVMGGTTWYLETRDMAGTSLKSADPYTLEVTATPLADPGEPDSMDQPVALELGTPTQAFTVTAANGKDVDHDFFAIDIPKDMAKKTRLLVEVTDVAPEVHYALKVFGRDRKQVFAGSAANAGANLRAEVKLRGPGRYLLHLRNVSGARPAAQKGEPRANVTKPYTIKVTPE